MKIQEIRDLLKNDISGQVLWDKEILNYYSVDASSYRIIPKVVVIPRNEKDVIKVIKIAKKFRISVTARGAGTGLVGNSLNSGIILDLKNFNSVKIKNNYAYVGSGVTKGKLDKELKRVRKFFPPNPSVGPYCSIGGMIGNNSSGSRSLKYGSVIDNIKKITFIDGNGKKIILPNDKNYGRKIIELANKIDYKKFPKTTKNSSGYRLDSIKSINDSHKIIAGSEGTLGIILSAEIKIMEIPKTKILYIIEYESQNKAARDCVKILSTAPSTIEFTDKTIMKNIDYKFNKKSNCLLFVEYDSKIKNSYENILKISSGKIVKTIKKDSEANRWWKYRDSSLNYRLKSIKNKIPHVIEDATVPVKCLADLFLVINEINKKFHTKTITYGHAGNGNIHVRLISDSKKVEVIKTIADEYFEKIINLGGTISGEHGDGLARSEYVRKQYGSANYRIFSKLKKQFDPENILNPGKIISCKSTITQKLENV
jgi:FAD/FMN-containing dehydrogenase